MLHFLEWKTRSFFIKFSPQGWVAKSMVSFNHWLSSIKTNTLSRYLTLVNANHASSNWAQNAENRILGLWRCKIVWGRTRSDQLPPRKRGLTAPCWYSLLLYSNLLATSVFIETPDLYWASQQKPLKCVPKAKITSLYRSFRSKQWKNWWTHSTLLWSWCLLG